MKAKINFCKVKYDMKTSMPSVGITVTAILKNINIKIESQLKLPSSHFLYSS